MSLHISPAQIELLLSELCVELGFCLPPDAQARLKSDPPVDADDFTDAVLRAEGLDPQMVPRHLHRDLRAKIAKRFRDAEGEHVRQRL